MPKITWRKPKPPAPVDPMKDLVNRYMTFRKITSEKMADYFGFTTGSYFRQKKMKFSQNFTLEDFRDCCRRLEIPPAEAAEALIKYLQTK